MMTTRAMCRRFRPFGLLIAIMILATSVLGGITGAAASELPPQPSPEEPQSSAASITIPSKDDTGEAFWPWAQGRKMFSLGDKSDMGWSSIVVHSLDTLKEIDRVQLPVVVPSTQARRAKGREHVGTLDPETGRLFVAAKAPDLVGAASQSGATVCPPATATHVKTCFGGVQIVNGETLQVERVIPFRAAQIDGLVGHPHLRAIHYASPAGDHAAKLYYVVEEALTDEHDAPDASVRNHGGNLVWVVQTDLDSGAQEWAIRVDACRYAREPANGGGDGTTGNLSRPATVFRWVTDARAAVWVGCHSSSAQAGTVVEIPLDAEGRATQLPVQPRPPVAVAEDAAEQGGAPEGGVARTDGSMASFVGPDRVSEIASDPKAGRVLMKAMGGTPPAEVWWVYDVVEREYVGTIGMGQFDYESTVNGLDPTTGRLYVLAPKSATGFSGGLLVTDTRRTPLQQPLVFPAFASVKRFGTSTMAVEPATPGHPARVFYRETLNKLAVIEDHFPVPQVPLDEEFAGRTLDLKEVEGVTDVSFDGAARGYGFRALLVGGAEAAGRAGPVDPGQVEGLQYSPFWARGTGYDAQRNTGVHMPLFNNPCATADRELIAGSVGPQEPVVLDGSGARGAAQPIVVDPGMRNDVETPYSRCSPIGEWSDLWATGLFGRPPVDEPSADWPLEDSEAACVANEGEQTDAWGDPVGAFLSARVSCKPEEASGWSHARTLGVDIVDVAQASSSFRVYRDPGRGLVARVESITRGVSIKGVGRIESVRGVAESWANGRRQFVDAADRPAGYDPNCDYERTAGTCFRTSLTGVYTPDFQCGLCEHEQRAIDALNRALGTNGRARMRMPDERLARGADNGFIAAVQKPDHERFADMALNNDLLQTVVPTLEIIRYASPYQLPGVGSAGKRGRQIYQFAGVEVSSSYGITCLLVYDPETNVCGLPKEPPGALTIALADTAGKPLAGGAFEVRSDTDGDGVLGLKDTLLPNGACLTGADGVGTCKFANLQPGAYLVSQMAAPPGFAKLAEAKLVQIESGQSSTLEVVNASNVSVITVKAQDENGGPLAGAVFAAYPDPDADGKVAEGAAPAGTCTTGADGTCQISVPAGSYVLVQTAGPAGLELIEPVAFTVSGGQTAAVSVVNYPPEAPAAPEPAAAPAVDYEPAPVLPEPALISEPYEAPAPAEEIQEPQVSLPEAVGGTVVRVIRAPGDAVRLLARDPKQAVAWLASLALFAMAVLAVRRRQQAAALIER